MTPDEAVVYWNNITRRIEQEAAPAAANAMARLFLKEVQSELSHSSPSAPGSPPGIVTGALRRSVHIYPGSSGPVSRARVVPLIVYARIQELGGEVHARHTYTVKKGPHKGEQRPGYLRWTGKGGVHFAHSVRLPPRPYMRPAHEKLVRSGAMREAAMRAVRAFLPR